jgi:hypothetical protein
LGVAYHEPAAPNAGAISAKEPDIEIRDIERIIRHFMRSTQISENIMLLKLGTRGKVFIDHTLPQLKKCGVIEEIGHHGGGDQRRFRLGISLQRLNEAVATSHGTFAHFLEQFRNVD